jgi:hypothetical protein
MSKLDKVMDEYHDDRQLAIGNWQLATTTKRQNQNRTSTPNRTLGQGVSPLRQGPFGALRLLRNHARPQAETVPISIDKKWTIANRRRFSEILLVEMENFSSVQFSCNTAQWQALCD